MPIYEYHCSDCAKTFEKLRKLSDDDRDVRCPECESARVERVLSGFATSGSGNSGAPSRPGRRFT